ncbi:hypothetical protein L195_g052678, partial [Trifolium pratense]
LFVLLKICLPPTNLGNFRWFHKLQPQTLLVSNYLQQSNKLPSLITVASTQDLPSYTTLVYLHLKPRFLHQSLKPADVEYSNHRLSRMMLSIISPPLQADLHRNLH